MNTRGDDLKSIKKKMKKEPKKRNESIADAILLIDFFFFGTENMNKECKKKHHKNESLKI